MNKYIRHIEKRASLNGAAIAAGKDLSSALKTKAKKPKEIPGPLGSKGTGISIKSS